MILRTPSPILEFCKMHNQVWMIEFSYEWDFMLHNAWLDIPYVFLIFIEMISDKHTWRKLIRFTYWWELVVHWAGPLLTLSFVFAPSNEDTDNCMLFFHQPFLIFVDSWLTSWYSLELQTWVPPWWSLSSSGMAESNTPTVLMVDGRISLVFAWKLPLQWLRVVILQPWLFMVSRDTVGRPLLNDDVYWHEDARHDVVASHCPDLCYWRASWCLWKWWK